MTQSELREQNQTRMYEQLQAMDQFYGELLISIGVSQAPSGQMAGQPMCMMPFDMNNHECAAILEALAKALRRSL